MTQQIHYAQRSMAQAYQRCRRMRWLENYEGREGRGLVPVRKSIHLVVGSAVHAGMEVLLREGQAELDRHAAAFPASDLQGQLAVLFDSVTPEGNSPARKIEERAVIAALADLVDEYGGGVELDADEAASLTQANVSTGTAGDFGQVIQMTGTDVLKGQLRGSLRQGGQEESPIIIDFGDLLPAEASVDTLSTPMSEELGFFAKKLATQPAGDYLREELSALIEGMTRAWARRRWRGVLEQFEVLEVEREGRWRLSEFLLPQNIVLNGEIGGVEHVPTQLDFLSRHDALLLDRSTSYLYLQSFKTTGAWDRRKELDAQVDMQGLSEAVDVEQRFGETWELIKKMAGPIRVVTNIDLDGTIHYHEQTEMQHTWRDTGTNRQCTLCGAIDCSSAGEYTCPKSEGVQALEKRIAELVSPQVAAWLRSLPDPPQILGIRYEYLLKGMRKKQDKDPSLPKYVQESVLVRAWKQEGVTSDDRRWAWTYEWQDQTGKSRRLDYRSWQKAPVWRYMTIADWIDKLDRGEIQPDMNDEMGKGDALASQLVPVVVAYRNRDEALDWLEQLEAQERQVVLDVVEVREAEAREGYAGKRSALNRLFPQNRQACSYPGLCQYRQTATQAGFCFGGPAPEQDAAVMERFVVREPNHPGELVQIQVKVPE